MFSTEGREKGGTSVYVVLSECGGKSAFKILEAAVHLKTRAFAFCTNM